MKSAWQRTSNRRRFQGLAAGNSARGGAAPPRSAAPGPVWQGPERMGSLWRAGAQRARPSAVLVPATCDATRHIDAIGPHDALAAARMAKCVEMHCQQFAHRDKQAPRPPAPAHCQFRSLPCVLVAQERTAERTAERTVAPAPPCVSRRALPTRTVTVRFVPCVPYVLPKCGDSAPICQKLIRVYGIRATQEIHAGV
jgi:hypothetical protein